MKKIDRETAQRILDTADIVEVVSDFVSLKRRGANYIGLCPFHNERTPSFSVSKAKGICKCFSCGKGGSPVNFLMELEQISYQEALRYLAKKYNIEIKEHELTDEERRLASERESLFAVNEMALEYFENVLSSTPDGQEIGLSYFRERGINDWAIKRFRLGYSLPGRTELYKAAKAKGFSDKFLSLSGLCMEGEHGEFRDRFRGRVMYPIFTVSGKVVGFGGRTLRKDKDVAKYVNSPESPIYRKSYELYGLYQAKQGIVKKNKCILVEGYMDVISMHQSGIDNVVASSGTSLTEGQIRLIHRFTDNVTVIYDSDPAGIKASLRGIDMLLAEGMNIKVLLLPDGDDPDSFAQSHSSTEVERYIADNEQDFIAFKTKILLQGVENDPIARSKVITDIVQSISVIPDPITRSVYIKECSHALGIDERVLTLQVNKFYYARRDTEALKSAKEQARRTLEGIESAASTTVAAVDASERVAVATEQMSYLSRYEKGVLRYALKYGMMEIGDSWDDDGNQLSIKVIDFINDEMASDEITFTNDLYRRAFQEAMALRTERWDADSARFIAQLDERRRERWDRGVAAIRSSAVDLSEITAKEQALQTDCDEFYQAELTQFTACYIEKILTSSPDDDIRRLTTDLVSEKYHLSKVHTKFTKIETEIDRLDVLVERAVYELKDAILECQSRQLREELRLLCESPNPSQAEIAELMRRNLELTQIRAQFAKYLGERIVAPRK